MPTTQPGKAVTRYNRLAHGLRAEVIVLPGVEDEDEWCEFHDAVHANLDPANTFESEMATRAAELMWRLRRIARAERAWVDSYARPPEDEFSASRSERIVFHRNRHLAPDDETTRLIRYEAHLGRQLNQLLNQLRITQDRRLEAATLELEASGDIANNEKLPNEPTSPPTAPDQPQRVGAGLAPPVSAGTAPHDHETGKLPNELRSLLAAPDPPGVGAGLAPPDTAVAADGPVTGKLPNELRSALVHFDEAVAAAIALRDQSRAEMPFNPPSALDTS